MNNQEKAKEEFTQVYIEHCKKCKEIATIKNQYGMLDGHGRETKELTIKLLEEMERIKKKYGVDKIDFYYEDASKIFNKVFFDD